MVMCYYCACSVRLLADSCEPGTVCCVVDDCGRDVLVVIPVLVGYDSPVRLWFCKGFGMLTVCL